jgi:hypothetical protein
LFVKRNLFCNFAENQNIMSSTINNSKATEKKANFFQIVLEDKRNMKNYIRQFGSLAGFKSKNFEFAKPL